MVYVSPRIKSRIARSVALSFIISALIQIIIALVTDFWQIGPCVNDCFWRSGLPWTTHQGDSRWIAVLVIGIIAAVLCLVSLVIACLEVYVKKWRYSTRLTHTIIAFLCVTCVVLILHWLLYLIFSSPLKGYLAFSFASVIVATILLIAAVIAYCIGIHYFKKWLKEMQTK